MRRSRLKLALLLTAVALFAALLCQPLWQIWCIGRLERAAQPSWYLGFSDDSASNYLSDWVDEKLRDGLYQIQGDDGSDRVDIQMDRIRSVFRRPIQSIRFNQDTDRPGNGFPHGGAALGDALARFTRLRELEILDFASVVEEREWIALFKKLQALPVEHLVLRGDGITDASIASLAGHPTIRRLEFFMCELTSHSSATFSKLPALTSLILHDAEGEGDSSGMCTAARSATTLEKLQIYLRHSNDAVFAPLAGHPNLRSLRVVATGLTPRFMATLATLPRLNCLILSEGGVITVEEWTKLLAGTQSLAHLETLDLDGEALADVSHLTDVSIAPLAGHPTLRTLVIRGHHVTPSSISTFASIPNLKDLQIENYDEGPLKPHEAIAIISALPTVKVTFIRRQ